MYTLSLKGTYKNRRPRIDIDADFEPLSEGCTVCMTLYETMGQPTRYTEFTPDEARKIASMLIECAAVADRGQPEPVEQEEQDV